MNNNQPKFLNPYLGLATQGKTRRLNADVDAEDYNFISALSITDGAITTTMATLWQKICYELRKRNITSIAKQDEFEQFVLNCCIVLPGERGTTCGIVSKTDESNDRGRVKRVRAKTT